MSGEILSIGQSGMAAAKTALQTTSHNISNVNTEGYSRQRIQQVAAPPVGAGSYVIGTGTYIRNIERIHDDFLEKKINTTLSEHNYNQEKHLQLTGLESIFNEINYEGLNSSLNSFFNAFRELSNSPGSETARSLTRESARVLVNNFHRFRDFISQTVTNVNYKLDESVMTINNILDSLSRLNVKIREVETANGESGDLRDERDVYLNKLSEFFCLANYTDDKGRFVINAQGVGTLVNGNLVQHLTSASPPKDELSDLDFPDARGVFIDKKNVSENFQQGKIGALIETRNNEMRYLQQRIDEIAWIFANSVNAIHRRGYANKTVDLGGDNVSVENDLEKISGINFFSVPVTKNQAAGMIDISVDIKNDLANVVTALEPNSPGDNRVALAISKLQYASISPDGKKTIEEDYLQTTANLALSVGRFRANTEQSEGLLAQARFFKETLSGVSIDEEAANMSKYQHAFEASARVMKVADEMFKAVLGIKS
ncbi:MAG: flagellar hook-associated protein FlgK [Oligoflexia bacterium]|nr:flagellar hook-associated protein FlgK [Oligoflexia bacterium]